MTALFGMDGEELVRLMGELGQKRYRAEQVGDALYKQRVVSAGEITVLPAELREELRAKGYEVGLPEIVQAAKSVDGTERYLMRMGDSETVETVWMPDGDGGERGDGSEAAEEEEGEVGDPEDAVEAARLGVRGREAGFSASALRASGRNDIVVGGTGEKQSPFGKDN